jgi:diketogulonate reductase-like aldo/keto reductase
MTSGRECYNAVTHALNAGYRAIDSAEWYENEEEVGEAINAFIRAHSQDGGKAVTREDIWFTTKLKDNVDYQSTRRRIQESIRKSGLGWIDLYLLHSPYGGKKKRIECWRAVCDAVKTGEVRCVGVSNFGAKHVRLLSDSCSMISA